ncbi:MAG: hypothetical protein MJ177_00070 [Clostridia bacterium]|nr:hypothetical protein [Clostridia bacterium]
MKTRIRVLSGLCAAVISVSASALVSSAEIISDRKFTVNKITVERTSAPHVGNCFAYANAIYKIIWGKSFNCTYKGDSDNLNMLYGLSDDERLITAQHTKNFIEKAPLGAVIRITNAPSSSEAFQSDSTPYNGKYGHNVIITAKDGDGFYCLEDWRRQSNTSYYTWEQFGNQYNDYTYYKYIKWPVAEKKKPVKNKAKKKSAPAKKNPAIPECAQGLGVHDSDVFRFESFSEIYSYEDGTGVMGTIINVENEPAAVGAALMPEIAAAK